MSEKFKEEYLRGEEEDEMEGKEEKKTPKEPVDFKKEKAKEEAEKFFEEEKHFIEAYAGDVGLIIKEGPRWAFSPKTGEVFYSLDYFTKKGFTKTDAFDETLHEVEHFIEWLRDPKTIEQNLTRFSHFKRLHRLHNGLEDAINDRRTGGKLPLAKERIKERYKTIYYPKTDLKKVPKHLQFATTLQREIIVPEEKLELDPKVREEIEKLRAFGKNKININELVTLPALPPKERIEIIKRYIEPIYEKFFQEDLKERRGRIPKGKGKGEKAKEIGEDIFSDEYQQYDEIRPNPVKEEDLSKQIKEHLKSKKKEKEESIDEKTKKAYEKEHGVSFEDIQNYQKEYRQVEPYIEELREIFEKIISRRVTFVRKLSGLKKEGVIIEPGLLTEAYVQSKAGQKEPAVWRKIEKKKREREAAGGFEITLVNDRSSSMDAMKLRQDRLAKILFMETLVDFENKIKEAEEENNLDLDLYFKSEVRAFSSQYVTGDKELKELSSELDEKTRVRIYKELLTSSLSTPDFASIQAIEKNLTDEQREKIEKGELKKIVVVLTDGGSDDGAVLQRELKKLRAEGVIVLGLGMIDEKMPKNRQDEIKQAIKQNYAPDAAFTNFSKVPEKVKNLLKKYIENL